MKSKVLLSVFCALFFIQNIEGQSFSRYNPPVTVNGQQLKNPWAGGLNAPQFSEADFNNDGIVDLFVFDRVGDVPMVFLNGGTSGEIDYTFAPEYLEGLPDFTGWALMRDFDGDGISDVFCSPTLTSTSGIEVHKGFYENNRLKFELFKFPNFSKDVIPFTSFSGQEVNLAVTSVDIPAIDDIDGDGDLDVVTFNLFGGKMELFENLSVDRGYDRDSLIFRIEDNCWGGIYESGSTKYLDLASEQGECAKRRLGNVVQNRHAGSTILTLDMDNDGDKEVLLGDISFDHMVMAFNGGDASEAWMNKQDTFFPSDNLPIDLPSYPAAFYLDVDNDGMKDLIAARNAQNGAEDDDMAWFYKNVGSNEFPEFSLRQTDFLVREMLDFGTGAFPVFEDVDLDGRTDLIVGNESFYSRTGGANFDARLWFFKNTGTNQAPEFELIDDNWLNFQRFSPAAGGRDWAFVPAFGDLNHDGFADLVVGSLDGGFYYAENDGAGNFPIIKQKFLDIDVSRNSAPAIADFDNDNLNDVLLGETIGNINFFKNIGTSENPDFEPDDKEAPNVAFFGEIDLRENGFPTGSGTPSFLETKDGLRLITGNEFGNIKMFELGVTPESTFTVLEDNFGNTRNGERTDPSLADIDGDFLFEMVVGNYRGGLTFYKTDLQAPSVGTNDYLSEISFEISPNPASERFSVKVSEKGKFKLFDPLGRVIFNKKINSGTTSIEIENQSPGMYFLTFENEKGRSRLEKLIIE